MEPKYQVFKTLENGTKVLITFKEAHYEWSEAAYNPIESIEIVKDEEIATPEVTE
jgi:hypothetical protein